MKKGYMISLFVVCAVIIVLIGTLMWKRHSVGVPDQQQKNVAEQPNQVEMTKQPQPLAQSPSNTNGASASQAQSINTITTKDTMCIYENIDKKDGTVSMQEEKLPEQYIGLNRKELEAALLEDSRLLVDKAQDKGFQSQHLELFSPEKIKILRIYDTTAETEGYYIMELDAYIRIYKADRETVYFRTELLLQDLPENVQQEIIEGKYMDSELKVYHFLESYSS